MRGKPISGRDDEFSLNRLRLFADWRINDDVRLFAEAIDASSVGEDFSPRATEVNRFDAQNLAVDLRLLANDGGNQWWVRAGRQEMILGSTRLVFRRPWRNTPQNFDGVRTWVSHDDSRFDAFWLKPIDVRQHAGGDTNFDRANSSQDFFGLFLTLPSEADEIREAYYLGWNENDKSLVNFDGTTGGFSLHIFGGRLDKPLAEGLKFEIEGGLQFGRYSGDPHFAGFTVVGLRRKWANAAMNPEVAVYHDWASGDDDFGDSHHGTFIAPFQRGHYFFGFADITGRQNIHDVSARLSLAPREGGEVRQSRRSRWARPRCRRARSLRTRLRVSGFLAQPVRESWWQHLFLDAVVGCLAVGVNHE
ncbi:MAG: alginate export family protein [Pirellulaceae bacterium]